MLQKLLEPDNLKIIIPVFIGFLAACIGFASAFTVAITSHFLQGRSEINKIKITKVYSLSEKISKRLQIIENKYKYLLQFWEQNYGHVEKFSNAVQNFNSKQVLFQREYTFIASLMKERHKLEILLNGAWLYLPDRVVKALEDYTKVGEFSHVSDAGGLLNDFHEKFFENLLNDKNKSKRKTLFQKAAKLLKQLRV